MEFEGVNPHYTCTVALRSLPAVELVQGPHHCRRDRCPSRVWSGTTPWNIYLHCPARRTQLTPMGRPERGGWLPQPGWRLMSREELLGYHNNNKGNTDSHHSLSSYRVTLTDRHSMVSRLLLGSVTLQTAPCFQNHSPGGSSITT